MHTNRIKPLGSRVLVLPRKETVTPGGIVLSDNAVERPQEGKVVAVGEGRMLGNGDLVSLGLNEGDTVIYAKYHQGSEVKEGGETYLILDESSILAIKSQG